MGTKVCNRCHKRLPIEEFIGSKGNIIGRCKVCQEKANIVDRAYRENNREYEKARHRDYYLRTREVFLEKSRFYHQRNKEHEKQLREANKDKKYAYNLEYYRDNIDKIKQKVHQYYIKNRDKYLEYRREYNKTQSQTLSDTYVVRIIKDKGFSKENITLDLIELQRATILLKRQIKSYENETN